MTRKQRAKQSPLKKVRQKWRVNPKQLNEVKTECFLYQNSITDKQKQQRIHDLEQMIEELTLQQECQRKQFEELYAQMEKKDA